MKVKREMVLANVARTTIIEPAKKVQLDMESTMYSISYLKKKLAKARGKRKAELYADLEECREKMVNIKTAILNNPSLNIDIARAFAREFIRNGMLGKSEFINLTYPPKYANGL